MQLTTGIAETMNSIRRNPDQPTRTVHLTWKNHHPPEHLFPAWWRRTWEVPGWTIRLWTDQDIQDFAAKQSQEISDLLRSYNFGIMRADAFRYLLLKSFGGLYVDLDFVNLSSLDWLVEIGQFACADQGDGCLCNAFMWAPYPEDPFFDGIEDSLLAHAADCNPVSATGPRFLTAHSANKAFFKIPGTAIYPVRWDCPEAIAEARRMTKEDLKKKFPDSQSIHIWTSSWFDQCLA